MKKTRTLYRLTYTHRHYQPDDVERTNFSVSVNHAEFATRAAADAEQERMAKATYEAGVEYEGAEITEITIEEETS